MPTATASAIANPCGSILSIVNRPAITTTTCNVQPGHVEVESGWSTMVTTGAAGGIVSGGGITGIRIGTAPHLDLLLAPPIRSNSSSGTSGWSDSGFGLRDVLGYSSKWLWGVNGVVTVPTGCRACTAGGMQYTGNFNWAYTVNATIGVSGTFGFNQFRGYNSSGGAQPYFAFAPSLEATANLPGPSMLFAEYAYYSQAGIGLGGKSIVDAGYVHGVGSNLAVDIEVGESPTLLAGQRQHYVGAGLTFMH